MRGVWLGRRDSGQGNERTSRMRTTSCPPARIAWLKEINEPNINHQEARHLHPWRVQARNIDCCRNIPQHTVQSYRYPEGVSALAIRYDTLCFLDELHIRMVLALFSLVTLKEGFMKVHGSLPLMPRVYKSFRRLPFEVRVVAKLPYTWQIDDIAEFLSMLGVLHYTLSYF